MASDYDLEGRAVARRLDKAMNIAPNEPGALEKLGDALVSIGKILSNLDDIVAEAVSAAVADAVKWLSEHANSIAALGDVLAAISGMLGAISLVILLIAPVTGPLAPEFGAVAGTLGVASGAFALGALGLHATARAVGGETVVSNRTLAQDALGVLPFGGAFKGVTRVVAASRAADAVSNFGLVDSVAATIADPTTLGYFAPTDGRQTLEAVLPGGGLLVAFENAWKAGSEKDKEARQGK
ncbi:hypothetical protein [Streptomyces sp. NPDC055692]|uniref:hypothetical protein n=1 Tax=Streptomyces sp. NPDC055692 TaxID=3155683 RepID=UPI0034316D0F